MVCFTVWCSRTLASKTRSCVLYAASPATPGTYSFAGTFVAAISCTVALVNTAHRLVPLAPVSSRSLMIFPHALYLAARYGILEKKLTVKRQTITLEGGGWLYFQYNKEKIIIIQNTTTKNNKKHCPPVKGPQPFPIEVGRLSKLARIT